MLTRAFVTKLNFDENNSKKVTGVTFKKNGKEQTVKAKSFYLEAHLIHLITTIIWYR